MTIAEWKWKLNVQRAWIIHNKRAWNYQLILLLRGLRGIDVDFSPHVHVHEVLNNGRSSPFDWVYWVVTKTWHMSFHIQRSSLNLVFMNYWMDYWMGCSQVEHAGKIAVLTLLGKLMLIPESRKQLTKTDPKEMRPTTSIFIIYFLEVLFNFFLVF